MVSRWIPLSLLLLQNLSFADIKRTEPSLFLEYEREASRMASDDENENPFTRIITPINVQKPSVVKAEPVILPPAKPVMAQKTPIGNDSLPFLVINKPVDAPIPQAVCAPADKSPAIVMNDTPPKKSLFQNLHTAKEKIMAKAREFLGISYGFGNKDSIQTDCSGFTQQVFSHFGVKLPRSAAEQAQYGEYVSASDLQVGDLMFYHTYKDEPSHVAIYAGDNQIIHASYKNKRVQYDNIDKGYYKQRFMYAKRLALKNIDTSNE